MPIRAVAVDIDGTVTDYTKRLDWEGVEALRALEAQGIPVMPATGNIAPVTKAFASYVGLTGPAVCENGGVAYDASFKRRKALAARAHADRAVNHLRRRGFPVRPLWSDPWRESEVALELNLDEEAVRQALSGWRLDVVATRFAIHIVEPGLHKFNGLRAALTFLHTRPRVRPSEVLAIGDSNNDVELLAGCGHSGVVGNATEQARAAARYAAPSAHGAGVREILEHHGLL